MNRLRPARSARPSLRRLHPGLPQDWRPGLDAFVRAELDRGLLWPEPWISLNPCFEPGGHIDGLVDEGVFEVQCREIFRIKSDTNPVGRGGR